MTVDIETGEIKINRLVAVHDSGKLINPMIVDGQIIGGSVHGVGNALFEYMAWDEEANLLTTNLGEYLPTNRARDTKNRFNPSQSPTDRNPIGVKGAGEGGTIPVPAAVIAAVEDALKPFGVVVNHTPLSPQGIVALIQGGIKGSTKK